VQACLPNYKTLRKGLQIPTGCGFRQNNGGSGWTNPGFAAVETTLSQRLGGFPLPTANASQNSGVYGVAGGVAGKSIQLRDLG